MYYIVMLPALSFLGFPREKLSGNLRKNLRQTVLSLHRARGGCTEEGRALGADATAGFVWRLLSVVTTWLSVKGGFLYQLNCLVPLFASVLRGRMVDCQSVPPHGARITGKPGPIARAKQWFGHRYSWKR